METFINYFSENYEMIFILTLSVLVGMEVIAHVPSVLHTPLMSGANALSGVVVMGGIIVMGFADPDDIASLILGFVAVILGMFNVVGGFAVTDRMLEMFKKKPKKE